MSKPQSEVMADKLETAIEYLSKHFSTAEKENDPRLKELLSLLHRARRTPPTMSIAALVIEFDQSTGRPKVNEEFAQRYFAQEIEKALADAEWKNEFDVIEEQVQRDFDLVERARKGNKEAAFQVQLRRELHQEALARLTI